MARLIADGDGRDRQPTRIFGIPGKTASAVRRLGMAGIQRTSWLKAFFMNEARGVSGDLPELLKA